MRKLKAELFALIRIISRCRDLQKKNPFLMNVANVKKWYLNAIWYRNLKKINYYKACQFLPPIAEKINYVIFQVEITMKSFKEKKSLIEKLEKLKTNFLIDNFKTLQNYYLVGIWFLKEYFIKFRHATFLYNLYAELMQDICKLNRLHQDFEKANQSKKYYLEAITKWIKLCREMVEESSHAYQFNNIVKSFNICI